MKTTKSKAPNASASTRIVDFSLKRKKATVTVSRKSKSSPKVVNIAIAGKKDYNCLVSQVDLKSMKSETLEEALKKVAHSTGNIASFRVTSFAGKAALVKLHRNERNGSGFAIVTRRGKKNFTVPLDRVDLSAMKSETLDEACAKAAWATGKIAMTKVVPAKTVKA